MVLLNTIITLIVGFAIYSIPIDVWAGLVPCDGSTANPCDTCELVVLGEGILDWLIGVMLVVFAIVTAWAGFRLVTSGGNPGAKTDAKSKMLSAFIGIIITLSAWILVDTLMRSLLIGGEGEINEKPWSTLECIKTTETTTPEKPAPIYQSFEDLDAVGCSVNYANPKIEYICPNGCSYFAESWNCPSGEEPPIAPSEGGTSVYDNSLYVKDPSERSVFSPSSKSTDINMWEARISGVTPPGGSYAYGFITPEEIKKIPKGAFIGYGDDHEYYDDRGALDMCDMTSPQGRFELKSLSVTKVKTCSGHVGGSLTIGALGGSIGVNMWISTYPGSKTKAVKNCGPKLVHSISGDVRFLQSKGLDIYNEAGRSTERSCILADNEIYYLNLEKTSNCGDYCGISTGFNSR